MHALPYRPHELAAAFPDYVRGRVASANPTDPVAADMLDRDTSLASIVRAFDPQPGREAPGYGVDQAFTRGLGSSDFAAALSSTVLRLAQATYDASDIGKLAATVPVKNFKGYTHPSLSVRGDLEEVEENGEVPTAGVDSAASLETVTLGSRPVRIRISRQVILGDDVGVIAAIARQLGQKVVRAVHKAIVAKLESTATLSDGRQLFNATDANVGTAGAPSVASLNEAIGLLRALQDPSGEPVGVAPRYLLCPPALEMTCRVLLASLADLRPVDLVVSPFLASAARWFILADPVEAPTIGLHILQGSRSPLLVEAGRRRPEEDGTVLWARTDFAVSALARYAVSNAGA